MINNFSRRLVQARLNQSDSQSLGFLYVYEGISELFRCCTLELPWRDNKRNVSAIPPGRYRVRKRWSQKFGWHFYILNVPGRDGVLCHRGNFYRQTEGCVLVGSEFKDINGDGENDVINSAMTLTALFSLMPEEFYLDIVGVA